MPSIGLELRTPRSRVCAQTDWVSRDPLCLYIHLSDNDLFSVPGYHPESTLYLSYLLSLLAVTVLQIFLPLDDCGSFEYWLGILWAVPVLELVLRFFVFCLFVFFSLWLDGGFLCYKVTLSHPSFCAVLFVKVVSMHSPHLWSGDSCSLSLTAEYLHKLFGILLHGKFVFSPSLIYLSPFKKNFF